MIRAYRPERPRDTLADYLAAFWASRRAGLPVFAVGPVLFVWALLGGAL